MGSGRWYGTGITGRPGSQSDGPFFQSKTAHGFSDCAPAQTVGRELSQLQKTTDRAKDFSESNNIAHVTLQNCGRKVHEALQDPKVVEEKSQLGKMPDSAAKASSQRKEVENFEPENVPVSSLSPKK